MNEDEYRLWQDCMKEILILRGLFNDVLKRLDNLYEKVDNKLDVPKENKSSDG
jgi:tetrahydromethanopterin S-methyltransferase subunit G